MQQIQPVKKIKHDGNFVIAVGKSRKETAWKNKEFTWAGLLERLSQTVKTRETLAEFLKSTREVQDQIKDVGGFVGGPLKGGRRSTESIQSRQLLTLDADSAKPDFWDSVSTLADYACAVYSTHKHSPEKPRLRLVIPLSRPVLPDEYQAISRRIAADIGMDYFDDTTYQPHRLMYWPSTPKDIDYFFEVVDDVWMDPDAVLARYPDWTDSSYWPESSRESGVRKKQAKEQGDPLTKPGLIGAFCRTYSMDEAIREFLSECYTPTDHEGRYTYSGGSCAGGLIIYEDKFAYSHHGTDPISGKLCNAFDLVRIHLFGFLDLDVDATGTKLPSYKAMTEFVSGIDAVRLTLGREKLAEAVEEFGEAIQDDDSWLAKLDTNRNGTTLSTINNVVLILENDPRLAGKMALDKFSGKRVIKGKLPWKHDKLWRDSDESGLRHYLESVYRIEGVGKVLDGLSVAFEKNGFHPVKEYLDGLQWDEQCRLDGLFIEFLGAKDSDYVRAVTRKMLVAAVARIMAPGTKFDCMLVLTGPQGLGKSYLLSKLGGRWYSDSLVSVQGKEAYEQIQGCWILEMAELTATRKADVEAIKHFLSKQEDNFRPAYGRNTVTCPRQCVFFGTTNEVEFLRDRTGNRRFWPVDVGKGGTKDLWKDLDQNYIDQVWAEALARYQEGEKLYLDGSLAEDLLSEQEEHMEVVVAEGPILEFIDILLPEDWEERDLQSRRNFIHNRDFGEVVGTVQRDKVCVPEIWAEMMNGDPKNLTNSIARDINSILRRLKGWESSSLRRFGKLYGSQRAFVRCKQSALTMALTEKNETLLTPL